MDVNLELYKIFNTIVRSGSFSGAAKELFISQPAVSQAIKHLEEMFGMKLFIRTSRGISMTREGALLHRYVSSALNLIKEGETRLNDLSSLSAGELWIGASDSVSKWYLLPAMKRFHDRYPDVSLRITNRTSPETIVLLKEGKIDIGFVNMPLSAPGVAFENCHEVHDIFVAGEAFSELKGRTVTLSEIAEYPLIMLERTSNSRRWVDRHFLANGILLNPQIELGAHDLLIDYANIGLGISCIVQEFSGHSPDSREVFKIDIDKPVEHRSISACYLEDIGLSAAARKLIDLVKEERK